MRRLHQLAALALWTGILVLACAGWLTPDTLSH